jgi:hypothetical protein
VAWAEPPRPAVPRTALPIAAPPVEEGAPSYALEPLPDGGFRHRNDRWTAHVHPDGTVTFEDRRVGGRSVHLQLPLPARAQEARRGLGGLKDKLARNPVLKLLAPAPSQPRTSVYGRVPNAETCFLPDGTNVCDCDQGGWGLSREERAGCNGPSPGGKTLGGTAHHTVDFGNEYLRARGKDPNAQEKAAFLAATFEQRLELARKARAAARDGQGERTGPGRPPLTLPSPHGRPRGEGMESEQPPRDGQGERTGPGRPPLTLPSPHGRPRGEGMESEQPPLPSPAGVKRDRPSPHRR